jgi:hypothetical protein
VQSARETASAGRLRERGSEEGLSDAGRADGDDVLLGAHPLARRQAADDVFVEAATRFAPDVFEAGVGHELGLLQSSRKTAVLAVGPLAVDHERELLLEGHPVAGRPREKLAYGLGHGVKLEVVEFLDRLFVDHSRSSFRSK